MVRHHAALVAGTLTRVTLGVNLPPLEVIMSRRRRNFWDLQSHPKRVTLLCAL